MDNDNAMTDFLEEYKDNLIKIMEEVEFKDLPNLSLKATQQISEFYNERLLNTDSLYRGTSTNELDNMIETGKFEGGKYDYVCLSVNKKIAETFAGSVGGDSVVIEYDKDSIGDNLTSQGYDTDADGDSDELSDPQGMAYVEEEEHRIFNGMSISDAKFIIHVKNIHDTQKQDFIDKYSQLGEIKFD